jgi:hypothetical protein
MLGSWAEQEMTSKKHPSSVTSTDENCVNGAHKALTALCQREGLRQFVRAIGRTGEFAELSVFG